MITEIINFLVPTSEAIQVTFFSIITTGVAVAIFWVLFTAREAAWERKWQGGAAGAAENGLDIEHGSVNELSQAVATRGEKVAAMMPGLLLIIGLLGTFLGLGLALDKASTILQSSGNSVGAMDDSMQNLMAMMQGLGTKFKTSTWGIIAYILLKLWESGNGFEERRLNWCIRKIKAELGQYRTLREQAKQASEDKLQDSIRAASKLIVATLNVQTESFKAEWTRVAHANSQLADRRNEQWVRHFETFSQQFGQHGAALEKLVEQASQQIALLQQHADQTNQMIELSAGTQAQLENFTQQSGENIAKLSDAASTMQDAAAQVATSSDGLKGAVSTLEHELKGTLDAIASSLNITISQMGLELSTATQDISESTQEMSTKLGIAVDDMKLGLERSVSQMSKTLSGAAGDISENVKSLGETLNHVLGKMQEGMQAAFTNQDKALGGLDQTSKGVSAMAEEMKGQLTKLGEDIQAGLRSISTSTLQMKGLVKTFEASSKTLQELPHRLDAVCHTLTASFEIIPKKIDEIASIFSADVRYSEALDSLVRMPTLVSRVVQTTPVRGGLAESAQESLV